MEVRKVQLGRYEYTLSYEWETDAYWVVCCDLVRTRYVLAHGPFDLEEAHTFIDVRVQQEEDVKRY